MPPPRTARPTHTPRPRRWQSACWLAALWLLLRVHAAAEPAPRMLLLDAAATGSDTVAVGERGTLLRTADQGRTWQAVRSPVRAALTAVAFAPAAESARGWAVGHDAVILSTTDAGRTWTKQFQGENLQDSFLDVIAVDAQRVIAIGAYALLMHSADGGQTWSRRKIVEDDYHFNRITRGPTGTLYIAGEHGTLLRSTDAGATWAPIGARYEGSFFGILPLAEKALLAYGLRGHVYRSTDDGANWTRVEIADPVMFATGVRLRGNAIVLAGQARAMWVSHDEGKTFGPSTQPLATAVAELVELLDGSLLALGEASVTMIPPLDAQPVKQR